MYHLYIYNNPDNVRLCLAGYISWYFVNAKANEMLNADKKKTNYTF